MVCELFTYETIYRRIYVREMKSLKNKKRKQVMHNRVPMDFSSVRTFVCVRSGTVHIIQVISGSLFGTCRFPYSTDGSDSFVVCLSAPF